MWPQTSHLTSMSPHFLRANTTYFSELIEGLNERLHIWMPIYFALSRRVQVYKCGPSAISGKTPFHCQKCSSTYQILLPVKLANSSDSEPLKEFLRPNASCPCPSFLKDFMYLFLERGKEGKREGEQHQCVVASHTSPTGDLACSPGMCPGWELNQQPFGSQAST